MITATKPKERIAELSTAFNCCLYLWLYLFLYIMGSTFRRTWQFLVLGIVMVSALFNYKFEMQWWIIHHYMKVWLCFKISIFCLGRRAKFVVQICLEMQILHILIGDSGYGKMHEMWNNDNPFSHNYRKNN